MEFRGLNILVESKVPYMQGLLEPLGVRVDYAHPDEITPARVRDTDGMIVRTRTRCDAALLGESRCRFVATATIGTDHIDLGWCAARGITVANAPGCNAPAVAQYVLGTIAALGGGAGAYAGRTIGVVGVGHVGSIVARWARSLGMRVLECDPPRERAEGGSAWATLAQIAAEADIVTFHTPLTLDGPDATLHLCGRSWLSQLRRRPLIINAARGPVVDTAALTDALDSGLAGAAAIDCWEGEPRVPEALLRRAAVATPHIAGYSADGKWRATRMALDALTAFFGLPEVAMREPAPGLVPEAVTAEAAAASYNPLLADTPALKAHPELFEQLRNGYELRRLDL